MSTKGTSVSLWSIFMVFLTLGCADDPRPLSVSGLEGVWLPGSLQLDQGVYIPTGTILTFQKDSILRHYSTVSQDTSSVSFHITDEGLYLDTILIRNEDFLLTKNYFVFDAPYNKTYFRPESKSLKTKRVKFRNNLRNTSWTTGTHDYFFNEEEKVFIKENGRDAADEFCWRVSEYQGLLFLVIFGNQSHCENISHPLRQIVNVSDNTFNTKSHLHLEEINETYTSTNKTIEDFHSSSFQLCNENLYINNPNHRYYYKETGLKNGHANIRRAINAEFNAKPFEGQDGLVRIRFVVNCEGKTGLFEAEEMALDYSLTNLNDEMTQELLEITKRLGPWTPGRDNYFKRSIDTYYFITYRIINGEVVDIFP